MRAVRVNQQSSMKPEHASLLSHRPYVDNALTMNFIFHWFQDVSVVAGFFRGLINTPPPSNGENIHLFAAALCIRWFKRCVLPGA